ncbi:MAG: endonuclease/exonuclease/phosphatase family protein [Pyrinomonadaceae bacterium MAG19_C2-C3]|nr:endonuclease/exonuclease/phosphatase family protein [Pyrinomonadaceae bacterium MAG19_C2-C3]
MIYQTLFSYVSRVALGVAVITAASVVQAQTDSVTIHQIQGTTLSSPLTNQVVTTGGIVTHRTANGFYIQTPDANVDNNPATSEGVFVFTNTLPSVNAGDVVTVRGTVTEYFGLTEINDVQAMTVVSSGNALPAPVTLTAATWLSPRGGLRQLEPLEGMRVGVGRLLVVSPIDFRRTVFAVLLNPPRLPPVRSRADTTVKQRVFRGVATFTTRPLREPGIAVSDSLPPGAPANVPRFDENPERIAVDLSGNLRTPSVAAGETIAGASVSFDDGTGGGGLPGGETPLIGVLDFAFGNYKIIPTSGYSVTTGARAIPVPAPNDNEFTIASFNLQEFYRTRSAFTSKLPKAALAIRTVLRLPDILGVQEAGDKQALDQLAARINADTVATGGSDPRYVAYLFEADDDGSAALDATDIDVGFLVKSARVAVTSITQEGKSETFIDPTTGNPAMLNDRPPLVLRADVFRTDDTLRALPSPVTVIVNHLRSLIDIDDDRPSDTPAEVPQGGRVREKRRLQAEYLARLIQARQTANPNERIISIGDYNAFQFNDGYVDTIGTILGTPTPADTVTLASNDLVEPNLFNLLDTLPPSQRYSFIFEGNAQTLDHIIVNQAARSRVTRFTYARNNADFPDALRTDTARPERVSDHDLPIAYLSFAP